MHSNILQSTNIKGLLITFYIKNTVWINPQVLIFLFLDFLLIFNA